MNKESLTKAYIENKINIYVQEITIDFNRKIKYALEVGDNKLADKLKKILNTLINN